MKTEELKKITEAAARNIKTQQDLIADDEIASPLAF